jgi:hypothetical protein
MIHPENRADVAIVDDRLTRTPARRKKIGTLGGARLDLLHSPGERCYPSIFGVNHAVSARDDCL